MTLSNRAIGALLALGSAFFFGLSHSVVVLAYNGGTNPVSVSATRFILPIVLLVTYLAARGATIALPRRIGVQSVAIGLVTATYTVALLAALDLLPAGVAMLVFYLYPLFTAFFIALLRIAPFERKLTTAAAVALLGLGLVLGVRLESYSLAGLMLGTVAAVGLAFVSAVSGLVIKAGDPLRATIYMASGALFALVTVAAISGGFEWPRTETGWVGFLLSHMFFAVAMIMYFIAIDRVGAPLSATLGNLQPLVVIAVAFYLLDQTLTGLQLVGAAIVVGALFLATYSKPGIQT